MKSIIYFLSLEAKKYKKNNLVIILLTGFVLLFCSLIFLGKKVFQGAPPPFPSYKIFYEFPTVWDYQGVIGNWLVSFFIGFLVIYSITSEIDFKTMRQSIINGFTRQDYFMSKLIFIIALSLIATIIYTFSTLIIGMFNTEYPDFYLAMDNNHAILRFFVMCMGYSSFAMLVAFLVRRGFLSLLIYIVVMMFLESLLRYPLLLKTEMRAFQFMPLNSIEDLMPNPFYKLGDFFFKETFGESYFLSVNEALISSSLYTFLFIYLSWLLVKKRDL
ncbi:MAG: ABC transporter permease subunit [Saprospiraceae bacterium]